MSSLLFSIPSASGASPAPSAGASRSGDAQKDASASFGAALSRMKDSRANKAEGKAAEAAEAGTGTPLSRRRGLASADDQKDKSPAELLAMALLTPAFANPAAQQRRAADDVAAAGASPRGAADATDPLAAAGAALPGAAVAAVGDAQATDPAAAQADAATRPAKDAKAATDAADADDLKKAQADAAALPEVKATAPASPAVAAAAASAQPAPVAPAAGTAAEPKAGHATQAIAAVDPKAAPQPTGAALRADDPSLRDPDAQDGHTDSAATLPASMSFKTAMAEAIGNAASAAPQQPVARLAVPTPVGSEGWGADVGRQMIRMGADGHHVAELSLNPAGLGPLKVTLTLGDGQAQAMFVSAHESVRRAVEAALPQLRDTLAGQGIQLGQASVDAGAQQQQAFGQQERAFEPGSTRTSSRETPGAGDVEAAPVRAARAASRSAIDTFA